MKHSASEPSIIRPVGPAALWSTSRHSLGLVRNVIFTCRYVAPKTSSGRPIRALVEAALAAVVARHPLLRVGIARESGEDAVYVELGSVDFEHVIQWHEASYGADADAYTAHLVSALEAQHDRLWDDLAHRPGWKVLAFQNAAPEPAGAVELDIAFAFHPAIADADSAFIFHRDLLRALNGGDGGNAPDGFKNRLFHLSPPTPIPPPLETVIPLTVSWLFFLRVVILPMLWARLASSSSRLKSWLTPRALPWTGGPVSIDPFKTNIRLISVPPETADALLAACRQKRTSLAPLIHALLLACLSPEFPAAVAPFFTARSAVSLRRASLAGFDQDNTVHCLASGYGQVFGEQLVSAFRRAAMQEWKDEESDMEQLVWDTAADIGRGHAAKMARPSRNDEAAFLKYEPNLRESLVRRLGKGRDATWAVSDAGAVKAADATVPEGVAGWQIDRVIFSQGAMPLAHAFAVSVAGVERQGLCVTLSWQETAVEDDLADSVVLGLREWIDRLTGGPLNR